MPDRRLKAVWDVNVPVIRDVAGVHEEDGACIELPPGGPHPRRGRARDLAVDPAPPHPDPGPVLLRPRVRPRAAAPEGAGGTPRPMARGSRRLPGVARSEEH